MDHYPSELPHWIGYEDGKSKVVFRDSEGGLKQIKFDDQAAAENAMSQLRAGKSPVADERGMLVGFE